MFAHVDKNRFRVVFALIWLLAFAGSAFSAAVGPMYFEGKDSDTSQTYWDELMGFKAWGTKGISMFRGSMPDTSGATGTADGDFVISADNGEIGGEILVGGDLYFEKGSGTIIKGPVRTMGNFESGSNGTLKYQGLYCVEGTIGYDAYRGISNAGGNPKWGNDAKTGVCDYSQMRAVPVHLSVPKIQDSEDLYKEFVDPNDPSLGLKDRVINVSGNNIYYIDVPEKGADGQKLWDLYYQKISITNGGELRIRMPYKGGGRLVRIFLNDIIHFDAGSKVRVEYVNEEAVFVNGAWTGVNESSKVLDKMEYAGNVLIYMKNSVDWSAFHGDDLIEGTLITQGKMKIGNNVSIAGQLIADTLEIGAEFNGKFRYVPFDPAVLKPEAFASREYEESGLPVEVSIRLDTNTVSNVFFDYCFELTSEEPVEGKTSDASADITDFDAIEHLCGTGNDGRVAILAGTNYPTDDTKIYITPKLDLYKEVYGTSRKEKFILNVFNMSGAVINDNDTTGSFVLYILDKNTYPETRDTVITSAEDDTLHFSKEVFPYYSLLDASFTGVRIESLPPTNVGSLTYKGKAVAQNQVIPVDSLEELIFVPKGNVYGTGVNDALTAIKFAVVDESNAVSSEDKDVATGDYVGPKTFTINVTPVNDAPVASPATYTVSGHSVVGGTNLKGSIPVKDVDDSSFTYAFDSTDANFKLVDSLFVIDANTGVISVKKGITLKRSTNDSLYVIGVVVSDKSASTGNDDDILSSTALVNIKISYDIIPPQVDIARGENTQGTWNYPTIIKTNVPHIILGCNYDGKKDVEECLDTKLVEGCHDYVVKYENPELDGVAYDSVKICLSTAAPVVTVTAKDNEVLADNIYTVVESSDKNDPKLYVNSVTNPITVTVSDTVSKVSTTYTVDLDLDTTGVSKTTLSVMQTVVKANIALDQDRKAEMTPVNGDKVLASYKVAFNGKDSVTVSYVTDNEGNIIKEPVLNEKGKIDSVEVYTVTYVTSVNGKNVQISYKVDARDDSMLLVDANGNLMTAGAVDEKFAKAVPYTVSYDYTDKNGNSVNVAYSVDESGEFVRSDAGNVGYKVSYTYINEYGNSATSSVFIVLDQIGPKVEITFPHNGDIIHANFVEVSWEVNGIAQDTLTLQSLEKGANPIVRFYKDKAGNVAVDTVWVIMKDAKDINLSVEQPVTVVTKDKVEEYYASNPPKDGQSFAVGLRNPSTGKEAETLIGGGFGTEKGSGKAPYENVDDGSHLGPTLIMDIKVPVVSAVGGLATLDDLVGSDGLVAIDGVDADNSTKMSVEEYVGEYCDDVSVSDMSNANLYDAKIDVKIWVYTTLGNFVDYYRFGQELNDPSFVNDAGLLQMFFEQKPDKNGDVRSESGRLYATGSYVYKVDVSMKTALKCTLPPVNDIKGKKKGDVIRSSDDLLKPFGYKRPKW